MFSVHNTPGTTTDHGLAVKVNLGKENYAIVFEKLRFWNVLHYTKTKRQRFQLIPRGLKSVVESLGFRDGLVFILYILRFSRQKSMK